MLGAFPRSSPKSKDIARERLRMVLVNDRVGVSPHFLEDVRRDILKAVSGYMQVDEQHMEIALRTRENSISLVADIPVHHVLRGAGPGK